jgi:hypothetical protein
VREVGRRSYPEFAQVVADASALGKTCPPANAGAGSSELR